MCKWALVNHCHIFFLQANLGTGREVFKQIGSPNGSGWMWVSEMRRNEIFSGLYNIGDVAKRMVEVGYHRSFSLVYLLIELILVLPVATATVERAFSSMNIIKSNLRNKMGDEFLTDCLVCYIEKELFTSIDNEIII